MTANTKKGKYCISLFHSRTQAVPIITEWSFSAPFLILCVWTGTCNVDRNYLLVVVDTHKFYEIHIMLKFSTVLYLLVIIFFRVSFQVRELEPFDQVEIVKLKQNLQHYFYGKATKIFALRLHSFPDNTVRNAEIKCDNKNSNDFSDGRLI